MRTSTTSVTAETDLTVASSRSRVSDFKELLKPGISAFVVVTSITGYLLGISGGIDWGVLVGLMVGTGLTAGGAGTLNHLAERKHDALMERTKDRPLPSGRMSPGLAFAYGTLLLVVGTIVLFVATNLLTAGLAVVTALLYVLLYTPLKRVTAFNTLVGAIPGALPILGGYTAATGTFGAIGWAVFAILFLWQLPHFYSLAWMLRDDYEKGGFVMLPSLDPTGRSTAFHAFVATGLLAVAGLVPTLIGAAGWIYLFGMSLLGIAFLFPALAFLRERTYDKARQLMFASIVYVPVFFALVVIDFLLR
ncbi:MAG: heme o synthase [Rubricoccaceae bacterium]|nr:heme o synthase [Rubricoccaceae bacterium]